MRIRNTTPAPGVLLIDNIRVNTGTPVNNWELNNGQIKAAPEAQRAGRAWEGQPCYLNSNRVSDIGAPYVLTNVYPYIKTPFLPRGIGEISFWYCNWYRGPDTATPARLVIQSSAVNNNDPAYWSTIAVISNIVVT